MRAAWWIAESRSFMPKKILTITLPGRFALRSMMNVNQFYIENMAEDVKRGLYDNAKKGLVNGSLPLGYKRGADGKPEIDEPKAAIVREIYTRVAAGSFLPA